MRAWVVPISVFLIANAILLASWYFLLGWTLTLPVALHVLAAGAVVLLVNGVLAWFFVAAEHRKTAQRMRYLWEYNRALVERLHLCVQVVDDQGTVVFANERARQDLGAKVGQPCYAVLRPDGPRCAGCAGPDQIEWGETDVLLEQREGGTLFRINSTPVPMLDGSRARLEVWCDVTDEETFLRQLIQSEKLAAMGQLSASLAHELRSPLSVIRLGAFELHEAMSSQNGEANEALEQIEQSVIRCEKLIQNLLGFARESPPTAESIRVREVIESVLALSRKQLERQEIRVAVSGDPLACGIAGEDDLKLVVSNLLLNAVQAMPNGGILTVDVREPEPGRLSITFSDTGCGIAPQHLEKIFQPFFTTKEEGKGTGLGLAVCKKVVERWGGRISVSSEPGPGSTFTVELPAEKEAHVLV